MRLEDLPPRMREQALAQLGEQPKARTTRRGAGATTTDGVCWACGERFTSTRKWEAHSDLTGHRRFELVATREVQQ